MAVAGIAGLALGSAYASAFLGTPMPAVPPAFAFVLEAVVAVWFAGRRLGSPLTNDQRARIALYYTLGVAVLLAPAYAFGLVPGSSRLLDRLEHLSSGGIALALLFSALVLATVALARYLVLALVAPLVGPRTRSAA
jgi:hypothetical protein